MSFTHWLSERLGRSARPASRRRSAQRPGGLRVRPGVEALEERMLLSGYPIATHLISGIYEGIQNLMMQTRQREKMAALGKLSAGLARRSSRHADGASSATTTRAVANPAETATGRG